MHLISYLERDAETLGVVVDGTVHPASALDSQAPRTIDALLASSEQGLRVLSEALAAGAPPTTGIPIADVTASSSNALRGQA